MGINSTDTKASEGGGGGALGARAEIPLQPVGKTIVKQVVPLQPMEVNTGAEIPLRPVEDPMPEQVDGPGEGCDCGRAQAGAGRGGLQCVERT